MPHYTKPDIGTLRQFLEHITEDYKPESPPRVQQIRLLRILENIRDNEKDAVDIILGGIITIVEQIEKEYSGSYLGTSPQIKYSIFGMVRTGSDLYDKLTTGLNISDKNPLDDKYRFLLLRRFEQYANENGMRVDEYAEDKESKEPIFAAKLAFEAQKQVITRSKPITDLLLRQPPAEKHLVAEFIRLPDVFHERCSQEQTWGTKMGFGHSQKRLDFLKFITKLQEKSKSGKKEEKKSDPHAEQKSGDKSEDILHLDYYARYGTLLLLMKDVKKEYYWTSPTKSFFYQECQRVLNLNDPNDLDSYFQKEHLSAILAWVSKIAGKKEKLKQWQDEEWDEAKTQQFFDKLQDSIADQLKDLNNSTRDELPGPINAVADSIALYASQCGVAVGVAAALNKFVFSQLTIAQMTALVAPEYAIGIALLLMLQNPLKTVALTYAAAPLNPLVSVIFKEPLKFTCRSLGSLINFRANLQAMMEKPEDNPEWIHALLNAPEELFPADKKAKLRYVVDIEEMDAVVAQRRLLEQDETAKLRLMA